MGTLETHTPPSGQSTQWYDMHIQVRNFTAHSGLTVDNYTLYISLLKQILEKTEMAIKNGQSRETGNIGHKKHRKKTNKANKIKHRKLKSWPTNPCTDKINKTLGGK